MAYDLQIDKKRKQNLFSPGNLAKSIVNNNQNFKQDSFNYTETNEVLINGDVENTIVIKFQKLQTPEDELRIEKVISLKNIDNRKFGTFIILCGVLYGLGKLYF